MAKSLNNQQSLKYWIKQHKNKQINGYYRFNYIYLILNKICPIMNIKYVKNEIIPLILETLSRPVSKLDYYHDVLSDVAIHLYPELLFLMIFIKIHHQYSSNDYMELFCSNNLLDLILDKMALQIKEYCFNDYFKNDFDNQTKNNISHSPQMKIIIQKLFYLAVTFSEIVIKCDLKLRLNEKEIKMLNQIKYILKKHQQIQLSRKNQFQRQENDPQQAQKMQIQNVSQVIPIKNPPNMNEIESQLYFLEYFLDQIQKNHTTRQENERNHDPGDNVDIEI